MDEIFRKFRKIIAIGLVILLIVLFFLAGKYYGLAQCSEHSGLKGFDVALNGWTA